MPKILFASPFILETKSVDQIEAPAHRTAQRFIDALRAEGFEVVLVDEQSKFGEVYNTVPDLSMIVAMSFDGDWLVGAVNETAPKIFVHYFADLPGKRSKYIVQHHQIKKPVTLVSFVKALLY